ncbi:MAG TPA: cyclic nucleotide-binding domain-containing protein [Terriglobales bacterium]|nr:cyclic nucleotide-binding domain-containing protein [Terriglobales bacterium]
MPADALRDFDAIKTISSYGRGATLFREGHPPRGLFLLCNGRAKLWVSSEGGKRLTLRMAGPGEVLGLSALLSGRPYEVSAELMDNSQVAVVKRRDLLRFLRDHREVCLQVVHLLSQDVHTAYDRVRSVGLGRTRKSRISRVH